jgi:hypothetical protein
MEDFTELLDSIPEKEQPIQDIGQLAHKLAMVILTEALEGNLDAKRMANRNVSPVSLANACAAACIKVIEEELTKEVKSDKL